MEENVWNLVLDNTLKLPFVKVNRNAFLQEELKLYCKPDEIEKAIKETPIQIIDKEIISKIADGCIKYHLHTVTATSALAGIPGGWWTFGTVPADLAQFYGQVFCIAQKLMYLYGWPDITDENGMLDDDSKQILTLFAGVMLGVGLANKALNELQKEFVKQLVKRLPRMALSKNSFYNITKTVARWIGIRLTKEGFANSLGKLVPIIGAGISGALTYYTFKPMAKRLKKHCEQSWDFRTKNFKV